MRVAIIWSRFGPYHVARLHGAAAYAKSIGVEVIGLEVAYDDDVYDWDICLDSHGFERLTIFPSKNYNSLSYRDIYQQVKSALHKIDPDVVAINGWSAPEAHAALAWCRRRPHARAVLMTETKEHDGKRVWWKEVVKKQILRKFDAALVGGRKQQEYLQKLGFPHDRILAGCDVVDNDYFRQGAAQARADAGSMRRKFKLPDRYFFVCTRFVPLKNVDGLLQAYEGYRSHCRDDPWGLVVAGSGEEESSLKRLAEARSLPGIVWPGFVQYDELPVYYGLATAFVHPAKSEPWGLVVNEAAASGLPLLVSRTAGSRYELVEEGNNGFLFDPWRIEDITRILLRISELAEDRRAEMGARSAEIAGRWTPFRFGQQLFAASSLGTKPRIRRPWLGR